LLPALLERADVIVLSTDVAQRPGWRRNDRQIVCDVTAFGNTGPLQGLAYTDAMVQAISGLADTTGDPAGPPVLIGLPILEFSAGAYAASAVVAALRVRALSGRCSTVRFPRSPHSCRFR
jgi:crotonobetainyl-CoA:carnitine CoA-transferase CaiB-like acyl-CoA transferase